MERRCSPRVSGKHPNTLLDSIATQLHFKAFKQFYRSQKLKSATLRSLGQLAHQFVISDCQNKENFQGDNFDFLRAFLVPLIVEILFFEVGRVKF